MYNAAKFRLQSELNRLKPITFTQPTEAPKEFVVPFEEMFDKKFVWFPGDYFLELNIKTDVPKVDLVKKYRFTIFESFTENLKNHKKGFAIGAGVFWESPDYAGSWVEIEERNSWN
ncbi:MAG: hypothetical protein GY710_13065 [Desulfobacteraceae bacterium]|nr:hypothetical protein [Desulfobacteraceae bacterium]